MSELISRVGNTTVIQTEEKITFSVTGSGTDIVSRINESPSDGTDCKNLRICMDDIGGVPVDGNFIELVMSPNAKPIDPDSLITLPKGTNVISNKEIKEYW